MTCGSGSFTRGRRYLAAGVSPPAVRSVGTTMSRTAHGQLGRRKRPVPPGRANARCMFAPRSR